MLFYKNNSSRFSLSSSCHKVCSKSATSFEIVNLCYIFGRDSLEGEWRDIERRGGVVGKEGWVSGEGWGFGPDYKIHHAIIKRPTDVPPSFSFSCGFLGWSVVAAALKKLTRNAYPAFHTGSLLLSVSGFFRKIILR